MKGKINVLIILLILILSVSYIFIAGDLKYQKASEETVNFGFANSNQVIDTSDLSALEIIIENRNLSEKTFTFHYYVNDQEVYRKDILIARNNRRIISAPEEVEDYIFKNQSELNQLRYEVEINWDRKEEEIYKSLISNQ